MDEYDAALALQQKQQWQQRRLQQLRMKQMEAHQAARIAAKAAAAEEPPTAPAAARKRDRSPTPFRSAAVLDELIGEAAAAVQQLHREKSSCPVLSSG
jgi:hypothetical protein